VTVTSPESLKRALIVFVKAPIPGEVKTRLIPHLTSIEAANLYKCFVMDVIKSASAVRSQPKINVAYQSHPKASDISWLGLKNPPDLIKQEGRSLGERLIHAFGIAFGRGAKHVIIIGSDSPNLPTHYLEAAFTALNEADVVLGPALDGGYYLVGLSRPCLKLFEDVSWSNDQIFERTSQNATRYGYTLKVLPSHYDIDTIDDLQRLHLELNDNLRHAPTTQKYLAQLAKSRPFQQLVQA
jgi:rSAM/selenodomain-associated transferase 1